VQKSKIEEEEEARKGKGGNKELGMKKRWLKRRIIKEARRRIEEEKNPKRRPLSQMPFAKYLKSIKMTAHPANIR
jgi:hypothetical protein